MKEFMLLIRTEGDHLLALSPEEQQKHLQQVTAYMGDLTQSGKLKSAQPLEMDGAILSGSKSKIKDGPFNETKEVIAGYFLIQAKDLDDAIQIARKNPIFGLDDQSRIEVRPIKVLKGING